MSYVRVPPDSTGKKINAKETVIGPDTVQTQIVHLADSMDPSHLQAIDVRGSASVRFAEGQPILSGFGNLKTTGERALGVYEASLDTYESLFTTTSVNGGALVYDIVASSQVLTTTSGAGSSVKVTTNRYHYYLPGSSNVFKMTIATGDIGKTNNIRRWGAFDDNDGIFFELNGTNINVVIRSSVTGSVVPLVVPKSAWNVDKLDGTGVSGYTLDITKINVYWFDFQWLGAGRVRFGIYLPDGSRLVVHQFQNAGNNTLPYMRTGTLPISTENTNVGVTGSGSELRTVCLAAYTEATYEDYAFWRFADVDATLVPVTTDTHICSLQATQTVNGKHNSVIIYPETLNVYCDGPVAITLWQATAVATPTWVPAASVMEITYAGTVSTTDSQKFKTIYFNTGATTIDLDHFFEKNDEGIQVNADRSQEVWSILCTKLTGANTNVTMNLGYKELW
jgi:hypothetical protein